MARQGISWLKGCALGCGILSLLAAGACVAGMMYFKHLFRGVSIADGSNEELTAQLGEIDAYVPPPDGVVPAPRLEIFLAVRESLTGEQEGLEAAYAALPRPEESEGPGVVVGKVMAGLEVVGDLIAQVGAYLQARNDALLDGKMGVGEYAYIYSLAYYSWLGHGPEDGPENAGNWGGEDGERGFRDADFPFSGQAVRRRHRRYLLPMLRAQLASLDGEPEPSVDDGWRSTLALEIRRFEEDPGRVMWRDDGLPAPIRESLEPFRARLETTYSRTTNCFELPLAKHEAPWSGGGRW